MELPLERNKNTDLEQIEIGENDVSEPRVYRCLSI